MANPSYPKYVLELTDGTGLAAGDLVVQFGASAFSTTGTNLSISTDLDQVLYAFVNPTGAGGAIDAQDSPMEVDTSVVSDAFSVTRQANGASGRVICWMAIGRKWS